MFSSAIVGLFLFASAIFIPAILNINPQRPLQVEPKTPADFDTSLDIQFMSEQINSFRKHTKLPALEYNQLLCPSAQYAVQQLDKGEQLDDILQYCPDCLSLRLIAVEGTYEEEEVFNNMKEKYKDDLQASEKNMCLIAQHDQLSIAIGTLKSATSEQVTSTPISHASSISYRDIPDQEVVEAINMYRASHGVHQLIIDQNLCAYAQKRVGDLIAHGGLDHHEGFKKDFENNAIPDPISSYSGGGIGENLAHQYCYRGAGEDVVANTGTALIEWCFDSSTAGHREAQLNPSYNAVCVRHGEHMYVVIFGE